MMHFEVEGFFERYAAMLVADPLHEKLLAISHGSGDLDLEIEPGEKQPGNFDLGTVSIYADNFMDRFDPVELRQAIQSEIDEAAAQADEIVEADEQKARGFLDAIHKNSVAVS